MKYVCLNVQGTVHLSDAHAESLTEITEAMRDQGAYVSVTMESVTDDGTQAAAAPAPKSPKSPKSPRPKKAAAPAASTEAAS